MEGSGGVNTNDNLLNELFGDDNNNPTSPEVKEKRKDDEVINILNDDLSEVWIRWADSLLDFETKFKETATLREKVEASLIRQQQDGFIGYQDVIELKYISHVWINLLNSLSTYTIGCEFVKRDIITYLVELYKLRQITENLFIESCLRL